MSLWLATVYSTTLQPVAPAAWDFSRVVNTSLFQCVVQILLYWQLPTSVWFVSFNQLLCLYLLIPSELYFIKKGKFILSGSLLGLFQWLSFILSNHLKPLQSLWPHSELLCSLIQSGMVIQEVSVLVPPAFSHILFSSTIILGAQVFQRTEKKGWSQVVKEQLECIFWWIQFLSCLDCLNGNCHLTPRVVLQLLEKSSK